MTLFDDLQKQAKKDYKRDPNKNQTGKNKNLGRKKAVKK